MYSSYNITLQSTRFVIAISFWYFSLRLSGLHSNLLKSFEHVRNGVNSGCQRFWRPGLRKAHQEVKKDTAKVGLFLASYCRELCRLTL